MRRPTGVCSIIPPHILRSIAERGDGADREVAWASAELSSASRGERSAYAFASTRVLTIAESRRRRTVFDARHKRDLPGRRVRGEGERPTGDAAVDEAYDGAGRTYDFFRKIVGRNSLDGRGVRLDSTVHYGVAFDNAQWNGRQMIYGDGDGKYFRRFTAALDVIAHELTHGVTQHSAGLAFDNQPGALNEHFSDVFGALVKQYANKQTVAQADWLIGAELLTERVQGVAVRSMKAPGTAYDDPVLGRDPQPSHMRDYVRTRFDRGGVHVNSGIPNHAFYRAATLLGGRAWEVAGRIWYDALTRRLSANARFQQCADATFAAAGARYGVGSEPQNAVAAAWKAVGIRISPRFVAEESIVIPDPAADAAFFPIA